MRRPRRDPEPGDGLGDGLEDRAPWDVMLKRGARKRCPRCGAKHVFASWFRMDDRCPGCGFLFEREPGFFVGAYLINFAFTEGLLFVVVMGFVFVLAANTDASIVVPLIVGGFLAIAAPLVFYPFARTIWSAIDLSMTPLELEEIIAARDHINRSTNDTDGGEANDGPDQRAPSARPPVDGATGDAGPTRNEGERQKGLGPPDGDPRRPAPEP